MNWLCTAHGTNILFVLPDVIWQTKYSLVLLFLGCDVSITVLLNFLSLSYDSSWNFQGCIAVYLSRYKPNVLHIRENNSCSLCCFSAATLISYHECFALSTTFLNFFIFPAQPIGCFCGGVSYYHKPFALVNTFFEFLKQISLLLQIQSNRDVFKR